MIKDDQECSVTSLGPQDAESYLAHLTRLDARAQVRRFGGQLATSALSKHVERAIHEAAYAVAARADGRIFAVLELWPVRDGVFEIALTNEGRASADGSARPHIEIRLLQEALQYAGERGVSQIIYQAGSSEGLPKLPSMPGVATWRPWSEQGAWVCDLVDKTDGTSRLTRFAAQPGQITIHQPSHHVVGGALSALGQRGPLLLVGSLLAGALLPTFAGAAYTLLPLSAFLLSLGSFLAAGLAGHEAKVGARLLLCVIAWLCAAIPLIALAVLHLAPLDPTIRGNALLSVLAPPVGSAAAIAAMLGLRPRLALLASILLTMAAPLTMPLLGGLLELEVAMDMGTLAARLISIIGLAAGAAFLMLRFPSRFAWATHDQQAGTGLAVLGLIIVGLATAQGVRAQWLANPADFERMLALAFTVNFGLCILGMVAFWWLGPGTAATIGLLSGNRNVTLAWAVVSMGSSSLAEGYLAASVVPVLALPLMVKWGKAAVVTTRRLSASWLGQPQEI